MRRPLYLLLALAVAGLGVQVALRVIGGRSRQEAVTTARGTATLREATARASSGRTETTPRPRLPATPSLSDLRAALAGASVVIVVLDAARADHIGCYGYPRATTPELDRLAAESVVFDQHFCPYPATTPSTASLLTGLYPDTHGAVGALGERETDYQGLDPATFTLEQGLRSAGFFTLMCTANEAASPAVGVGDDFDKVWQVRQTGPGRGMGATGREQIASTRQLVRQFAHSLPRDARTRFFGYVHVLPPHLPYDAPEEVKDLFLGQQPPTYFQTPPFFPEATRGPRSGPPPADGPEWANLYDANLRWADQAVGMLRAALEQAGRLDRTLLIVTADHGEALGEHGYSWHETVPYDEALHIPLIVRFPGASLSRRVEALTQTVDIAPTILEMLSIAGPGQGFQGRSLVPLLTGEKREVRRHVFAQTYGPYDCRVVRDKGWALLQYREGRSALYDLSADPRETRNVIASHAGAAASLKGALREFERQQRKDRAAAAAAAKKPEKRARAGRKLSEDTLRELRSLGYL